MDIKRKKPISRIGTCLYCGKEFETFVKRKQYCNRICRQAMYRQIRMQSNGTSDFMEKECQHCHKIFVVSRAFKVYCSAECKIRSGDEIREKRTASTRHTKLCENCKTPFVTHKSRQIFCSSQCRLEDKNKKHKPVGRTEICPTCGKSFIVEKNSQRYCTPDCRQSAQAKKTRQSLGDSRRCAFCGKEFAIISSNQKYCSSACQKQNQREMYRQKQREKEQRDLQRAIYLTS